MSKQSLAVRDRRVLEGRARAIENTEKRLDELPSASTTPIKEEPARHKRRALAGAAVAAGAEAKNA
jgi:hypothetical protein